MKSPILLWHRFRGTVVARIRSLSPREFRMFSLFGLMALFGAIGAFNTLSNSFSVPVPASGGKLSEGILGTPRFINPVLATSDGDQDLTALIYSGLMRRMPSMDGRTGSIMAPDLAESYSVSDDGKTYTFTLRPDAVFHDGKPVTAADVIFTIKTISDSRFQSPVAGNWLGVTATATAENIVTITLPRAFSGFLESATVGILPEHVWSNMSLDEFLASSKNSKPVGSGPYRVTGISHNKDGIAETYKLSAFRKFTLGKPHISTLKIYLYPNEEDLTKAFANREFDMLANVRPYDLSPDTARYAVTTPLPRMFGLFMNPGRNPVLADAQVRSAIQRLIDPSEITTNVFQGYATPINTPLPTFVEKTIIADTTRATRELDSLGWKVNAQTGIREKGGKKLTFVISTADTAELKYTAQIIQKRLKDAGIETEIQIFQLADLETSIIRPRAFDTLLFGQFIRNDADVYAFWHSSQRSSPGLNITGYSTPRLDDLIEKLFVTTDTDDRTSLEASIDTELGNAPVVWLYQPDFIYALRKPVYGLRLDGLVANTDRFSNIHDWYLNTDTVWKIFQRNTD